MTPINRILDALRARGCGPKRNGKEWTARCPAHDDKRPSLSIGEGAAGRALVHCHAGCTPEAITAALGMTPADLTPDEPPARRPSGRSVIPDAPGRNIGPPAADGDANTQHDWTAEAKRLREQLTPERLKALADATGIPESAWALLEPGWATREDLRRLRAGGANWSENRPDGAWAIPEYAGGRIVGLSLRAPDGRKGCPRAAQRGLVIPTDLRQRPDPVLIVEGASDVAAAVAMGRAAVGRPSNRAGADALAELLDGRDALVVGENDGKPGGAWPGRDGAKAVAESMAAAWRRPVRWTLPPNGTKDIRAWLNDRAASSPAGADAPDLLEAGAQLIRALENGAREAKPIRRSQADVLVDMASAVYRLGLSTDGEAFAVPHNGPAVAIALRGGATALRGALARLYRERTGRTPTASALTDALCTLEGQAQLCKPEPLALRVGSIEGGVVVDLGDTSGRAVVVRRDGWAVEAVAPRLFRRSVLTAPLPEPAAAEPRDLIRLFDMLHIEGEARALLTGWMVAAMLPDLPHPILLLSGEQGAGKSTVARFIVNLIDASNAPLRSEPRDLEQWAVAAAGSWVVALDNISGITGRLSDALCRATTGDGVVRRRLYSDSDIALLRFQRVVILTSIDPGALRGDLGDRLLPIDLPRIDDTQRRTEQELERQYAELRPALFGALLRTLARVFDALPRVRRERLPRMADFARVLAALDEACPELTGGRALELYGAQRDWIAREVLESDPVAQAIINFMEYRDTWSGTAADLLAAISPLDRPPSGWPANPRALAGRLKRLDPALKAVGIVHTPPQRGDNERIHRLDKVRNIPLQPLQPLQSVNKPSVGMNLKVGNAGSGTGSGTTATAPTAPDTALRNSRPDGDLRNGSGRSGPEQIASSGDEDDWAEV